MKIILATPLFPPEIDDIARHVRDFSMKLRDFGHTVTIVAYSDYAEMIPGVKVIMVSKKNSLPVRLIRYFKVLKEASKTGDIICSENTLASGLPAVILSKFFKIPVVVHFFEDEVWKAAVRSGDTSKNIAEFLSVGKKTFRIHILIFLQKFVLRNAAAVVVPHESTVAAVVESYRVQKNTVTLNFLPAPIPEVLPFASKLISRKIVLLREENISELGLLFDELKKENEAPLVVGLSARSSSAEKWYHIQSAAIGIYMPSEMESPLIPMLLAAGTPVLLFQNVQKTKETLLKIFRDASIRNSYIADGEKALRVLSSEKHAQTFIDVFKKLR